VGHGRQHPRSYHRVLPDEPEEVQTLEHEELGRLDGDAGGRARFVFYDGHFAEKAAGAEFVQLPLVAVTVHGQGRHAPRADYEHLGAGVAAPDDDIALGVAARFQEGRNSVELEAAHAGEERSVDYGCDHRVHRLASGEPCLASGEALPASGEPCLASGESLPASGEPLRTSWSQSLYTRPPPSFQARSMRP